MHRATQTSSSSSFAARLHTSTTTTSAISAICRTKAACSATVPGNVPASKRGYRGSATRLTTRAHSRRSSGLSSYISDDCATGNSPTAPESMYLPGGRQQISTRH